MDSDLERAFASLFNKRNSLGYNFAHIGLPMRTIMGTSRWYKEISGRNASNYLSEMYVGLGGRLGIYPPKHTFTITSTGIKDGVELFSITFPKPQNIPEVFFVAIVYKVHKKFFSTTVEWSRYFTLELGMHPDNYSQPGYYICEWSGNIAISPEHKNYGLLPNKSEQDFILRVKDIVGSM